ncbi:MAG: RHS repeat protein [Nannocystaceae bacterium]|nr:RHS repeat protein [Nannocystaceae bacterium]
MMGWSWRHAFESQLTIRLHRITFEGYQGERIVFPRLYQTDEVVMHGYQLRRVTDDRFEVTHRRMGTQEFVRDVRGSGVARLVRVRGESASVDLTYDNHRRIERIQEHSNVLGTAPASYTMRYDEAGQLAEVWGARFGQPPARLVRYHYNSGGHLVRAEDAAGACEAYSYDGLHRLTRATDRNGYAFGWEYDHEGRCAKTQGEDGLWFAEFSYAPGTTTMKVHDGSAYTFTFDEDGVITEVVGPCGGVNKRIRDAAGRVLAEVDSSGRKIEFVYDEHGAWLRDATHLVTSSRRAWMPMAFPRP